MILIQKKKTNTVKQFITSNANSRTYIPGDESNCILLHECRDVEHYAFINKLWYLLSRSLLKSSLLSEFLLSSLNKPFPRKIIINGILWLMAEHFQKHFLITATLIYCSGSVPISIRFFISCIVKQIKKWQMLRESDAPKCRKCFASYLDNFWTQHYTGRANMISFRQW